MEIIILGLHPFSIVDDPMMRQKFQLDEICVSKLKRHVENMVTIVEERITKALHRLFCIIFDGWSDDGTH